MLLAIFMLLFLNFKFLNSQFNTTVSTFVGNITLITTEAGNSTLYTTTRNSSDVLQLSIEFIANDLRCSLISKDNAIANAVNNLGVSWWTSGTGKTISNSTLSFDSDRKLYYAKLTPNEWPKYMNEEVYCQLNNTARSTSDGYFLGLKLNLGTKQDPIYYYNKVQQSQDVMLNEGSLDGKNISVATTFPLLTKSSNHTDIIVYIDLHNSPLAHLSSDSDCFVRIPKDRQASNDWSLTATVYLENRLTVSLSIEISFEVLIGTGLIDEFKQLTLPSLNISYIPTPRSYTGNGGSCYNDPHCYTNDGKPFEFQYHDGEFVMYENEDLDYHVHMVSEPCAFWSWCGKNNCNYCIRSIYVQSLNDFLSFDTKKTPPLSYVDLSSPNKTKIPIVWFQNEAILPKATSFKITQDSYEYHITSQFGTGLVISKWGTFFEMIPSKLDSNRVFGVLGNYNEKMEDDFTATKNGVVRTVDEFFEVYNTEKQKLPQFSKDQYYNSTYEHPQYCTCDRAYQWNYVKVCQNGPVEIEHIEPVRRKRREVVDQMNISPNDLSYVIGFFQDNQPEHVEAPSSSCETVLRKNEMMVKCNALKIIDLDKLISDCELDFNSTKMDIWAEYYLNSRKGWCKNVLVNDATFFVTQQVNGTVRLVEDITVLDKLCLNGCSNQGNCTKGTCVCFSNFTGEDCSVNLKATPVLISTLFKENDCDVQQNKCQLVTLHGNALAPRVVVKYSLRQPSALSISIATNVISSLSITDDIVVAQLPQHNVTQQANTLSLKIYTLSVFNKDENSPSSNLIDYTIYNSNCHVKIDRVFKLKENTCNIDSNCYKNGDKNPKDTNYECNSRANGFLWSKAQASTNAAANRMLAHTPIVALLIIINIF